MTLTETFLVRIKKYIHNKGKKEDWILFSTVSKQLTIGILYQIVINYDKACSGRKVRRLPRVQLLTLATGLAVANDANLIDLATIFATTIESLLKRDGERLKIQKNFPEFSGDISELIQILLPTEDYTATSKLLPFVTYLTGKEDTDLLEDSNDLGRLLQEVAVLNDIKACYALVKEKKFTKASESVGFSFLRNIAATYSLTSTMKNLPATTDISELSEKEVNEICTAILRYPVIEDVNELFIAKRGELLFTLADIKDIFVDYPMSTVRKLGIKRLTRRSLRYAKVQD